MKTVKRTIDVLIFITTALLMDINLTGRYNHKVLGIILALILLLHIFLNFRWIKNVTTNFKKVRQETRILYIINFLTFVVYFATIILGLSTSSSLFNFGTNASLRLILAHHILGRLALTFMLIHSGFHLKPLVAKITSSTTVKSVIYIIYTIFIFSISTFLFYQLTKSYIWASIM